ncbi:hypothetical protein NDU88_011238, partial [Pleurodeles waltl]
SGLQALWPVVIYLCAFNHAHRMPITITRSWPSLSKILYHWHMLYLCPSLGQFCYRLGHRPCYIDNCT